MSELKILSPGGRIKSAFIGMGDLLTDPITLNTSTIPQLRKNPSVKHREAFFPRDESSIRQVMGDLGVYRPTINNDQGMPGQFLPFQVDEGLETSNLNTRHVAYNEGIALPELYLPHNDEVVQQIQKEFLNFNFSDVLGIMRENYSENSREATKGRIPYFFIRPGLLDSKLVFGKDILNKVQTKVTQSIETLINQTADHEIELCGKAKSINLIYGQADVFIDNQGNVCVGEIQTPDVGFFLNSFKIPGSKALPEVQTITEKLEEQVIYRIAESIKGKKLYLVTRQEVLDNKEDILETNEFDRISTKLSTLGIQNQVISTAQVKEIESGSELLLLNINYSDVTAQDLIKRHLSGDITCYPNPIFQMKSQTYFGGDEIRVEGKYRENFMKVIQRKNRVDVKSVTPTLNQIHKPFKRIGDGEIKTIYHAQIGGREIVPVLANSLHSFGQLHTRIQRTEQNQPIILRVIPFEPNNSIIHTENGPLFHSFRFMFLI